MNPEKDRLAFPDNLRTFIIFLVVLYHSGWVYERSGFLSSVWIVDDPSRNGLAGILNMVLDIFMMPTMFFISGFFAPVSLKAKKGRDFIVSRFKRLMVPWLLAVLLLIPMYKAIFLFSRNLPQQNLSAYFHFTGGSPVNQGWLWFLPVLFLFDLIYLNWRKIKPASLNISLKGAVSAVFLIGFVYSFCMSTFGGYGWTKTVLLDFQNERLLIYFMMFLLGALCHEQGVFRKPPSGKTLYYVLCATIWLPMNVYIIFLLNLLFNPGKFILSQPADVAMAWLGFHLSMLGMLYIMVQTFRYFVNGKGPLLRRLRADSYGVYVIHLIVMGVLALVLREVPIPSLAKFAVLTVTTYAASDMVVFAYHSLMRKGLVRESAA